MVSVLAGLSAGIGSRADPASAAIRDAAPQGEREGRGDAARRSAASPKPQPRSPVHPRRFARMQFSFFKV
ncbi:hypothetical protein [Pannonibacter phragmitetus]|uniref:hypothetical protein n=1 Tax=Pannonibacter phragmitetus TaxID=121719 RepID=UPI003D2F0D11